MKILTIKLDYDDYNNMIYYLYSYESYGIMCFKNGLYLSSSILMEKHVNIKYVHFNSLK